MPKTVTPADIHAEFVRLGIKPNAKDFLTTRELMRAWGLSDKAVVARLHLAREAGILEVGRKQVTSLTGAVTTVVAYRIRVRAK